ncbi:MAG: hypothetical protein M9962_05055 [Oligoflexia bacterium]|nr:hypothetical protein [Oligoflexia bacterium]
MKKLYLLFLFFCLPVYAQESAPISQGLGGAAIVGNSKESLFSNPATVASLQTSIFTLHYMMPSVPDFNSSGRAMAVGVYDGTNGSLKGGLGYSRESYAVVRNGRQEYFDRKRFISTLAKNLWGNVEAGLRVNYYTVKNTVENKYFDFDFGVVFPIYSEITVGLIYDNFRNKDLNNPTKSGVGVKYALGYDFVAYGDGYRYMKGSKKGERGWAVGLESKIAGDVILRAGKFQEGLDKKKGWSLGLSWVGPRTSFHYALKKISNVPNEKRHVLGTEIEF